MKCLVIHFLFGCWLVQRMQNKHRLSGGAHPALHCSSCSAQYCAGCCAQKSKSLRGESFERGSTGGERAPVLPLQSTTQRLRSFLYAGDGPCPVSLFMIEWNTSFSPPPDQSLWIHLHGRCPEFAEAASAWGFKASGQFVLSLRQAATEIKAIPMHIGQSRAGYYLGGVATCPVAVTVPSPLAPTCSSCFWCAQRQRLL